MEKDYSPEKKQTAFVDGKGSTYVLFQQTK